MEINRDQLNACNASRKAERVAIADTLELIARGRGAIVERRNEPSRPGYSGQRIVLHMRLNGAGCMIDISDLHGGEWAVLHWFNTDYPARKFTSRFQSLTGGGNGRPHHKSTSHLRDWYSLAMMLDSGLMLADSGGAFEPITADASAT